MPNVTSRRGSALSRPRSCIEPSRIGVGQRLEQDGIDGAEDRRARADAERQASARDRRVKPGLRRSRRAACRTSESVVSTTFSQPYARTCSRTAVTLPSCRRAARRASSGDSPLASNAAAASSR